MVAKATKKTQSDQPNPNRRPRPASAPPREGAPTEASTASAWKKPAVEGALVTCPSGNVVRMRQPGMQAFLKQGMIPNALLPFVQEMMAKGGVAKEDEERLVASLFEEDGKLQSILELADSVVLEVVVEPKMAAPPTEDLVVIPIGDPRRSPDIVYSDEMDFGDKMFIFNMAVGGPANMEKFREGSYVTLAGVPER